MKRRSRTENTNSNLCRSSRCLKFEPLEERRLLTIDMFFAKESPQWDDTDIYIYWASDAKPPNHEFSATFIGNGKQGQPIQINNSYLLSDLSDGITLNISHSPPTYFSIGQPLPSMPYPQEPDMGNPSTPRFQTIEMSYISDDPGGVANLTNVSIFDAAIRIQAYQGSKTNIIPDGTLTYDQRFDDILSLLDGLIESGTQTQKDSIHQKEQNGDLIHFLSPQKVPASAYDVYPSFNDYLTYMNGKSFKIKSMSGVPEVQYNLTATVSYTGDGLASNKIVLSGFAGGHNGTITIDNWVTSAKQTRSLSQKIYSAPVGLPNYTLSGDLIDNAGVAGAVRDLYAGFNFGYVGSKLTGHDLVRQKLQMDPTWTEPQQTKDALQKYPSNTAVGDMDSDDWFWMPLAYQHVQPDQTGFPGTNTNPFFNRYSQVIFDHAGQAVYGNPFSDRWNGSKVVVTTDQNRMDGLIVTLLGDADASTVGLYQPDKSFFHLSNKNQPGAADIPFDYGPPGAGWQPVAGDWDKVGYDTVGLFAPGTSTFYLRNTHQGGHADLSFGYGPPGAGWLPIAGDWDGDGDDTIGLFDPISSTFYLKNTNQAGHADMTFIYGPAGKSWQPIVGDWDEDGKDTVGLYDPISSTFYLRNTHQGGPADLSFAYGPPGAGWQPTAGDWNWDGKDTIGLFDPGTSTFYLRNTNQAGHADVTFGYGPPGAGWLPVAGEWGIAAAGAQPLLATGDGVLPAGNSATLNQADLQPIIAQAIADWARVGLATEQIESLLEVEFVVTDLSGARLGLASQDVIYLDLDAARHGWFIDATPGADEEFQRTGSELMAIDPQAVDRIDLLTVVLHELGHTLGFTDVDSSMDSIMSGTLETGLRREPDATEIDLLFAHPY